MEYEFHDEMHDSQYSGILTLIDVIFILFFQTYIIRNENL